MKKLLILFCAAGMLAVTSCNNSAKVGDLKTPEDSLSYYLGLSNAAQLKQGIKHSPDSAKFNEAEFMKAVQVVMDADTGNVSYMAGLQFGMQMKQLQQMAKAQLGVEVNQKVLMGAVKEALKSDSLKDPNELQAKIMMLVNSLQAKKVKEESSKNEAAGKAYIEKQMKADKSIQVTSNGLAYKVITPGSGANFTDEDSINVIYTGSFINGEKFDSSNGQPREFTPKNVVPGFGEALKMMKPGAHYIVYIPGNLAYGEAGQPYGGIGPNQTLVFDIQTPTAAEIAALSAKTNAPAAK